VSKELGSSCCYYYYYYSHCKKRETEPLKQSAAYRKRKEKEETRSSREAVARVPGYGVEEELQQKLEQCKWDLPDTPLPKDLRTTTPSPFVAVVVPKQFCYSLVDRLLHRKIPRRRFFLPACLPPSLGKSRKQLSENQNPPATMESSRVTDDELGISLVHSFHVHF
jgi:hypothetical protein